MREVPILFFANKMDIQGSMDAAKVASSLDLDNITDRPWHIQNCSAKTGEGVDDGMNWLSNMVKRKK